MNDTTEYELNFWDSKWGLASTFSLGILAFILFSIAQSIFLVVYGFYLKGWDLTSDLQSMINHLAFNGDAISISEIPAAIIGILLTLLFASFCKPKSIAAYLQLTPTTIINVLKWLGIMVLVIIGLELANQFFERSTPEFMSKVYESTTNFPMLWFAVIVAAPFFEEILFRGYLFEGIKRTVAGSVGAVLITSSTWAIIHLQYQAYEIFTIFVIGVVMAIAKLKTNSLYVPIAMHMLMNLTASIGMELNS